MEILGSAYVYSSATTAAVGLEADVIFTTNGPISAGFSHVPSTSGVSILAAGVYEVTFSITSNLPNQFALFLDGVLVPGSIYSIGAPTSQNEGQVILIAPAVSVLTLRNHSSIGSVPLQSIAGGTQLNVNASLLITRLV